MASVKSNYSRYETFWTSWGVNRLSWFLIKRSWKDSLIACWV